MRWCAPSTACCGRPPTDADRGAPPMGISRFFRRARWDDERARELDAHLAIEIDDNLARGMSADAAAAAARRKLGNVTLVREDIYQMNTMAFFDAAWRDLKYGARVLRRNPGFTAVAVLSLALGVGANTAIFQLLAAVRLRTLPVTDPSQLVEVRIDEAKSGRRGQFSGRRPMLTHPLYERIRDSQQAFSALAVWGTNTFNMAASGEARNAFGFWTNGDFFNALGVKPIVGR